MGQEERREGEQAGRPASLYIHQLPITRSGGPTSINILDSTGVHMNLSNSTEFESAKVIRLGLIGWVRANQGDSAGFERLGLSELRRFSWV